MIRRRLVVTGRVQNVFYRDWFAERARSLGLDGWVRNRPDGSVEAVVQGAAEMVARIVALAHEGSPASRVAGVAVHNDARGDPGQLRATPDRLGFRRDRAVGRRDRRHARQQRRAGERQ